MHILLDENLLSKKLKQPLLEAGHTVSNINDMGWRGLKDRQILELATSHAFDLFITADKNLPFQQNLSSYALRVIVLDVSSTRPSHLLPLMIQLSSCLPSLFEAAATVKIDDSGEITAMSS